MKFTPITPNKWADCSWCYAAATRKGDDGRVYCSSCPPKGVVDLTTGQELNP